MLYYEIGLAYQQRAELPLAERPKELCESAVHDSEVQRVLVVSANLHGRILLGDLGHGGVHGRPLAPPTAVNAVRYGGERSLRGVAQGLLDDRVSPSLCGPSRPAGGCCKVGTPRRDQSYRVCAP